MLIHSQLGTRRKKANGGHLERLKEETNHHLYLVPACRAEETSREECRLHNQGTLISLTQNSKPVRDQSCGKSTRSSISKTRFAFLNSTLSGFYFAIVMFICCLFVCLFLCEFMLETLRTMFDLSMGG
ncbi:hypothetical protein B857_03909 [Solibacillus isronensis B3W22]|uniref:Uncharacterized protein n=1 Tax=Solibacillus isronensis B3W22 TaxID=1224748 RepID=K1KTW0_9BACL|nr:hypothetical protein B857_03909 [Solibacillus isronensis B3W22]